MASVEIKYRDLKEPSKPNAILNSQLNPNMLVSLKCWYLNATSLVNKLDELIVEINMYHPHLVAVSETWFKSDSKINVPGYKPCRKERSDGRSGGGVCLYIDESIDCYEVNDPGFNVSKIEQIWAVIYFGLDKYLVGCIYRPGGFKDMGDMDSVFKHAREYVDQKGFKDLLIMGDFNFPQISWTNGCVTT